MTKEQKILNNLEQIIRQLNFLTEEIFNTSEEKIEEVLKELVPFKNIVCSQCIDLSRKIQSINGTK